MTYQMNEKQKATQFKKGQSGNPGGINQHVRAQMNLNAQKATAMRQRFLDALESKIENAIMKAEIAEGEVVGESGISEAAANRVMSFLSPDINRLLTDSEDRGYGKPTQPTRDESAISKKITEDMTPEEAAEAYRTELEKPSGK